MSYFIFKEIQSDDMGIIVQNLPPITKPPKRYNINEVDGSSKSKIDVLGYKAYEINIPIGFKGADIQNVDDWLDGSGRLVLSNEPEKYYDAYILNQVDYEKAIRFRTANVPFFVQPYKHSTEDEETTSRTLINQGNTECLPLITITGSGQIIVNINGIAVCTLLSVNGYITLDSEEQEATKGTLPQNRLMVGTFPELLPGENLITFGGTGTVTEVKTIVRSRWL